MMDLQSLSFSASPLIQADDEMVIPVSDPGSLLPLLFSRIDNLYITTEELRKGVVEKNINLAGRVQSLGAEVVLLGDHIGCDPGLTDIPLRYTWEGSV